MMNSLSEIHRPFKQSSTPLAPLSVDDCIIADKATINLASKELCKPKTNKTAKKRRPTIPPDLRLRAVQYAISHNSPLAAANHFNRNYKGYNFSRSSISRWVTQIKKESVKGRGVDATHVFTKGLGRPTLLPVGDENVVKDIILSCRQAGIAITREAVVSIGNDVVRHSDPSKLNEFGGSIKLTEKWARRILTELDMPFKRYTTAKVPPSELYLSEVKFAFQSEINKYVVKYGIPPELIYNFDQIPLSYVVNRKYTFEELGTNNVPSTYCNNKRQITATFTCSSTGAFLPLQLIYKGETQHCLPPYVFPSAFSVIFNENHWANEQTSIDLIENIILPAANRTRKALHLPPMQKSLLIFDQSRGQMTKKVSDCIIECGFVYVYVPKNLTNLYQPLDLTVNRAAKNFVRKRFSAYFSEEVVLQLTQGVNPSECKVDVTLETLKPLHSKWIHDLFVDMQSEQSKQLIIKGFQKSGILDAITGDHLIQEDPFNDAI